MQPQLQVRQKDHATWPSYVEFKCRGLMPLPASKEKARLQIVSESVFAREFLFEIFNPELLNPTPANFDSFLDQHIRRWKLSWHLPDCGSNESFSTN